MLSINLIQRHFQANHLDSLLDALSANGLELPLPLRIRLGQANASAVAMALRRVIELTYGPTGLSRELTAHLLKDQQPDGSYSQDPLATAAVVSAFGRLLMEQPGTAGEPVHAAYDRALAALASMQGEDGLFRSPTLGVDRTRQERALCSAFILFLLAEDQDFRHAVRFADLLNWFEQNQDDLEADTNRLWLMARTDTSSRPRPSSNLAAIAA